MSTATVRTEAHWSYDDGGRAASGFRGEAGDCVARSLAIILDRPYREVYDEINVFVKTNERRRKKGSSSSRTGVYKTTTRRIMEHFGFGWTPTMQVGQGCTVHLRADELPSGRIIASVSKHVCAVIDGVVHDTHDPTREGTRCVYGYWTPRGSSDA